MDEQQRIFRARRSYYGFRVFLWFVMLLIGGLTLYFHRSVLGVIAVAWAGMMMILYVLMFNSRDIYLMLTREGVIISRAFGQRVFYSWRDIEKLEMQRWGNNEQAGQFVLELKSDGKKLVSDRIISIPNIYDADMPVIMSALESWYRQYKDPKKP